MCEQSGVSHILDGPCRWCGYNGPLYWQSGSHQAGCPWFAVGGAIERANRVGYVRDPYSRAPAEAPAREDVR